MQQTSVRSMVRECLAMFQSNCKDDILLLSKQLLVYACSQTKEWGLVSTDRKSG